MSHLRELMRETDMFGFLDDVATEALSRAMQERTMRRGTVLFEQGSPGEEVFIILEGKFKLTRRYRDGRENALAILGPGQMFGDLSLFDLGPRTATAAAVTNARVASLTHERLSAWIESHPPVARAVLHQLAARLRRSNDVVADLVFSDVPGRVARALLDLATRFGVETDGVVHVHHDLTQVEIAQLVGASRVTVNRALAEFNRRGWIRSETRTIAILNADRLRSRVR